MSVYRNRYRIQVAPITYIKVQYRMSGLIVVLVLTAAALLALCVRG